MRSKREIKDRLRQASFRYLKRILEDRLRKAPRNCGHNERADVISGIELGMCTIFEETGVRVCDSRIPGLKRSETTSVGCREAAKSCGWFVHLQSKEDIKEEWAELLRSAQAGDRGTLVRQGYGDLASLLWALDDEGDVDVGGSNEQVEPLSEPVVVDQDEGELVELDEKQGLWARLFGG